MIIPEYLKPLLPYAFGFILIASACGLYRYQTNKRLEAEIVSQQKEKVIFALQEIATKKTEEAKASDLKAVALAKTTEEAKQKALLEHDKSEALKRKLAALQTGKPLPLPGGDSNLDDLTLRDEIIAQQENEIQSKDRVIASQDEEIQTLTSSRDSWKQIADLNRKSLKLSEERVRAEQIAKSAIQRKGWLQEGRGALWGGALVFLGHAAGVF